MPQEEPEHSILASPRKGFWADLRTVGRVRLWNSRNWKYQAQVGIFSPKYRRMPRWWGPLHSLVLSMDHTHISLMMSFMFRTSTPSSCMLMTPKSKISAQTFLNPYISHSYPLAARHGFMDVHRAPKLNSWN